MSACSQHDKTISEVIKYSCELLQFRTISKSIDDHRLAHHQLLDQVIHTNVFDLIGDAALNLDCDCDKKNEIIKIIHQLEELEISNSYLKEFVLKSDDMPHSKKTIQTLNTLSARGYLLCKSRLIKAINGYLQQAA